MPPKKTTRAAPRPATRSSTSTSTSTSTGISGTRAKPIPQAASKAKATPASKGRAIVPTKAASSSAANKGSKGPGLTAEKEKLLKDLLEKKKKAAQEAAEAKKKASRKHAADCLLEEGGEDNDGSEAEADDDSLGERTSGIKACTPPTSRRRLDSPVEPEEDDEDSNMVSKVLDDGMSSDLEEDAIHDQEGEGKEVDEGGQDQEVDEGVQDQEREAFAGEKTVVGEDEEEESKKHITVIPRSKAKLSNLNSPRTKRIAVSAHKAMRLHVATVNGFPSSRDREELCWNLLVSSTKENEMLWEKMSLIQSDDDLKAYLIDYTWKAASQLRGELVAKARISVPATYGIGELKHEELEDALKWLLEEARFIHAGIEAKNLIYDDASPFQNAIFRSLLSAQWWGPKGEGRKSGQKKNLFFNNLPILALISCSVECVLLGIMRGSPMDFSEVHFSPRWDHYMSLLENFQEECPSYMEMIWDELKEAVWKGNAPASTEDTKASFNFSALETAGLAAKARKSASATGSRLSME